MAKDSDTRLSDQINCATEALNSSYITGVMDSGDYAAEQQRNL